MKEKMNVYQMVTDRIIKQLEQGTIPWEKPWTGLQTGAFNRISKKPYSLLNQMMLKHTGEYATFKQWSELGGKIHKGEKSEIIVYWNFQEIEREKEDGTKEKESIPFLRYYRVFHISQVDDVEPLENPFNKIQSIKEADELITKYISREGITFEELANDRAFYSPAADRVVVPKREQFPLIGEWYSTAFHELTHSTGHKSRLNRVNAAEIHFGDESYSKEELIAEIGSANIMNQFGIENVHTFRNSVAYIQSWLQVLKNDTRFIVSAASKAEKAVDYIVREK